MQFLNWRSVASIAVVLSVAGPPQLQAQSTLPTPVDEAPAEPIHRIIERLKQGAVVIGGEASSSASPGGSPAAVAESDIVTSIRKAKPTPDQVAALWDFFGEDDNSSKATLPIIMALAEASTTAQSREMMWSELAEIARRQVGKSSASSKERSLLGLFERHRATLLPLLPSIRETEGSGDEMTFLMTSSRVFGDDIWQGLFDMVVRNPGAVARMIERERERGRPVKWEFQGFEGMMRWKDARLVAGAPQSPATLSTLDAAGETFIIMFNALHSLDDWYREQMLRGLGPVELFNAVVGGEQELYRLGTSSYREFLHPLILKGIKDSGSFEAFLDKALPRKLGEIDAGTGSRRGLIFLRIASSFGLLDSVLETVRDRDLFVTSAVSALGDPRSFESSGAMVVDLVTGRSKSPQAIAFRHALLERLYELYRTEAQADRRRIFGSMLSVYQTVTGDRRDKGIDREFPLDQSMLHLPYDRLHRSNGKAGTVHRIFMRMHDDLDAIHTYASFRTRMRTLGASVREEKHFSVFRIAKPRRSIEIYVNKPDSAGVQHGISDIAKALRGGGVETIVGRGHTGIIAPLQSDSRRLLGMDISRVAAVIVGSCGGDASVREMIGTFGYVPFVTTKSTGRQLINNAIMESYIGALLAMAPGDTLSMATVLDRALTRFLREKADGELREDAKLYQVNLATVLVARLFDSHMRQHAKLQ